MILSTVCSNYVVKDYYLHHQKYQAIIATGIEMILCRRSFLKPIATSEGEIIYVC